MNLKQLVVVCIVLLSAYAEGGRYKLNYQTETPKNPSGGLMNVSGFYSYSGPFELYEYTSEGDRFMGHIGTVGPSAADCCGEVTFQFEWVRDRVENPNAAALLDDDIDNDTIPDPLDNPPAEVMIREKREAHSMIMDYDTPGEAQGDYSAECDAGLGSSHTYQNTPQANHLGEVIGMARQWNSQKIIYRKSSGGQSITVTCEGAYADAYNGGEFSLSLANVAYSVIIYAPNVKVLGAQKTWEGLKFITGQQLTASLEWKFSGGNLGMAPTIKPSSYQWTVNGQVVPFKDFQPSNNQGLKVNLSAADKKLADFKFYTAKYGECNLSCICSLSSPQGAFLEAGSESMGFKPYPMISVRPRMKSPAVSWPVLTGDVYPTLSPSGVPGFIFAGQPGSQKQGQHWQNVAITLEAPFGQVGEACFVQLIKAKRSLKRNTSVNFFAEEFVSPFENLPEDQQEVLDTSFPYYFSIPPGQNWTISAMGAGGDSPFQPIAYGPNDLGGTDWYRSEAHDTFRTWVMYRPPAAVENGVAQKTVWVPVAMYSWAWNGVAVKTSGEWNLDPNAGPSGPTSERQETTTFPSWIRRLPSPFSFIPKTW